MIPEIKQQWLDRLRSTRYLQGKGNLKRVVDGQEFHCCLGVLCEIAKEAGLVSERKHGSPDDALITFYDIRGGVQYEDFLPTVVVQWAGLGAGNPVTSIPLGEHMATLSWLNDNGRTFREIADIIERDF